MDLVGLLPLIAIAAVFWLLLIRPASRRQKEVARMQSALAVGDQVVLTSGIHGEITDVGDDALDVEVAPGVVLVVARAAIGTVRHDEPVDESAHESYDESSDGLEPTVEPHDPVSRDDPDAPVDGPDEERR